MTKIVKKRLRLKKKTLIIFLLCITLIVISITNGFNKKEKPTTLKKVLTNKEIKLDKLKNIDKKLDYFNYDYIDRYIDYKNKNKNLSLEDVITHVNIGIDNDYYTNTKRSPYLNKSYILINKYYYAGKNYIPNNLEAIDEKYARSGMKLVNYAKEAFEKMAKDASKEGLSIIAMSSYRSYIYQETLYNKYVEEDGKKAADSYSARPGFSEHQTGLAVDVYNGTEDYTNFENTKEFTWMQENAHKYGFILRFPKDKTALTGYVYESWHYRYVGVKIANYIKKHNLCYEEYYAKKIESTQ